MSSMLRRLLTDTLDAENVVILCTSCTCIGLHCTAAVRTEEQRECWRGGRGEEGEMLGERTLLSESDTLD